MTLRVRMTAMGSAAELSGRFQEVGGEKFDGPVVQAGIQSTPRHITYVVRCENGPGQYKGELIARNDAGESASYPITWKL